MAVCEEEGVVKVELCEVGEEVERQGQPVRVATYEDDLLAW